MITENMKPITREDVKVLGRIVNISTEGVVADAAQIWDSDWTNPSPEGRKDQSWINQWIISKMNDILSGNIEFDHLNVRNYIKSPSIYVDDIYPYTEGSDIVNIHNNLNVDNKINCGYLDVDHSIECNDLEVSGTSNLNILNVSGLSKFQSLAYFYSGIDVHGNSKFYNNVDIDGSVNIHQNLTVGGNTNLNNLTVNGTFNFHGQEMDLSAILRRLASLEQTVTSLDQRVTVLEECCEEMHQPKNKYSINWSAVNESNRTVASGSVSGLEEGDSGSESVLSGYTILSVNPSSGSIYGDRNGNIRWSNISSNGSVTFNVAGSDEPTPQPITTYTVTWNGSNYTHSNSVSSVNEGSSFSSTVTPDNDYEITSVVVTMGGNAIDAYNNGQININNVTGNIVITVETNYIGTGPEPTTYSISWNGEHFAHSNTSSSIVENEQFSSTVTADNGYHIESVTVNMGGTNINGAYNNGNINIASVTGNIVIIVVTAEDIVPKRNIITINVIDGVASDPVTAQVNRNENVTINEPTLSDYILTGVNINGVDKGIHSFPITIEAGANDITITYTWEKTRPTIDNPDPARIIKVLNNGTDDYFDVFGYIPSPTGEYSITTTSFDGDINPMPVKEASMTLRRYAYDDNNLNPNTEGKYIVKHIPLGIIQPGSVNESYSIVNLENAVNLKRLTVADMSEDEKVAFVYAALKYSSADPEHTYITLDDCQYIINDPTVFNDELLNGFYVWEITSAGINTDVSATKPRENKIFFPMGTATSSSTDMTITIFQNDGSSVAAVFDSGNMQETTPAVMVTNSFYSHRGKNVPEFTYDTNRVSRGGFTMDIVTSDGFTAASVYRNSSDTPDSQDARWSITKKPNTASGTTSDIRFNISYGGSTHTDIEGYDPSGHNKPATQIVAN